MATIGETIARLRHERGMTQETLAETLGVSPQTISKWENSVNLPDVQMLPLLADGFGVSVDALFGREEPPAACTPDGAFDGAVEAVRHVIADMARPRHESAQSWWERYNQSLREDQRVRSGVYGEQGVVYAREEIGVLALKKPRNGWHALLRSESAARAMRLLASEDFRRALACVLEHSLRDFTIPSLCKRADIEDDAALERCLQDSGLFERKRLSLDGEEITLYSLVPQDGRLLPLMAALAYGAEFAAWEEVFCCYDGGGGFEGTS